MLLEPRLGVRILGTGWSLPPGPPVTNAQLLALDEEIRARGPEYVERLSARIESKFGVAARHLVRRPWEPASNDGQTSEDLAVDALKLALASAGARTPRLLIHGTTTTSRYTGSQGASMLGRLGLVAPAYDIKAGCSTSVASLHMATAFLSAGCGDVAIACAETLSKVMDPANRETWFGLADGGAALWMERDEAAPQFVVQRSYFSTDGRHADLYTTPGRLPPASGECDARAYCLQGDKDTLAAVSRSHYAAMLDHVLGPPGAGVEVDWVIPHQVNRELIDDVIAARLPRARLVWDARDVGNLGGTSVLFSLARALDRGLFQPGDRILLVSVGGGLSSAAQVWERR